MDEKELVGAIQAVLNQGKAAWSTAENPIYDFPKIFINPSNPEVVHLIQLLEQQQELQCLNERMMISPNSAHRVTLFALARWLISSSQEQNIQATLSDLKKYLALDYNPTIEILAISGLNMESTIELGNGIFLAPINEVPSKNVRFALIKKLIGENTDVETPFSPLRVWMEGRKPPAAALYCYTHVKPQTISDFTSVRLTYKVMRRDQALAVVTEQFILVPI